MYLYVRSLKKTGLILVGYVLKMSNSNEKTHKLLSIWAQA